MAKVSSAELYINLTASQVRKLLKGRGFGVQRVEAAGRTVGGHSHRDRPTSARFGIAAGKRNE